MLRVALITAPVSWSGVEVHTVHLASALKERGHDVFIVELRQQLYIKGPLFLPCKVIHLDLQYSTSDNLVFDFRGFLNWWRVFASLQAEIIILVKGNFNFGSLAMEAAARLHSQSLLVVEHLHSPLSKRPAEIRFKGLVPSFGLWWYRQKLLGYIKSIFPRKVICVSQALASTLQKDYGYPIQKLVVAYSGVDTDFFVPNQRVRHQVRASMGIPLDSFVFGTLGRLSPMKNCGQLIRVFACLCQSLNKRDVRLVIVGEGPLQSSLQNLADSYGLQGKIVFSGFSAFPETIYPSFDVFCLPSIGEAFGLSLIEAMSCGCPVIASAVGGVPEILDDPQMGWLIPSSDDIALLSAMRMAIELDDNIIRARGANARSHVIRNFNACDRWDDLAKVIEASIL